MHFSTTAILVTVGFSALATAAPALDTRDSCSFFPWFIAPYPNTRDCTGSPAQYQPTSGPYNPNAVSTACRPLSNPNGAPASFGSVSINRDACPQQKWQINLYTDGSCGTKPTVVTTDSCVPAPGLNAGQKWTSFKAIRL